jgi:D-lyxose ketol-isomerase
MTIVVNLRKVKKMNRREMLGMAAGTVIVAGTGLINGCKPTHKEKKMSNSKPRYQQYKNEDFYNADGSFDAEKARQAYYEMMEHFNYPIVERLKGEEFWAVDFGLGRFTEVGMAGLIWVNDEEYNYQGNDMYLLPGQRIPEHGHDKTAIAGPKLESWLVRYGTVDIYGEGNPTPGADADIAEEDKQIWIAKTKKKLLPGQVGRLEGAETMHWMQAGDEGAIVSEFSTFHDGNALKFSNPNAKL